MTDEARVREVLEGDRTETERRIDSLNHDVGDIVDATADVATDDEHDPEGATIAFERSRVNALLEQARGHLVDLDRALDRLRDGTYDVCERCGRRIAAARLEARPVARTCIDCAVLGR